MKVDNLFEGIYMIKIAMVVFRECMEISMILGVILAATKTVDKSRYYILGGVLLGILSSFILSFTISEIANSFDGLGEEIFNLCMIFITIFVVGMTAIWIKKSAPKLKSNISHLSERIDRGISHKFMLVFVVATTMFREVTEIILFVGALASTYEVTAIDYVVGLLLGIFFGLAIGSGFYYGFSRFAAKYLFKLTFIFLVFVSASLASEAAGILTSTGIIEFYNDPLWDSSWLISDFSLLGKTLKTLFGYNSQPNLMQLMFYSGTIALIWLCSKSVDFKASKPTS